jgi:hypothetical protein
MTNLKSSQDGNNVTFAYPLLFWCSLAMTYYALITSNLTLIVAGFFASCLFGSLEERS